MFKVYSSSQRGVIKSALSALLRTGLSIEDGLVLINTLDESELQAAIKHENELSRSSTFDKKQANLGMCPEPGCRTPLIKAFTDGSFTAVACPVCRWSKLT